MVTAGLNSQWPMIFSPSYLADLPVCQIFGQVVQIVLQDARDQFGLLLVFQERPTFGSLKISPSDAPEASALVSVRIRHQRLKIVPFPQRRQRRILRQPRADLRILHEKTRQVGELIILRRQRPDRAGHAREMGRLQIVAQLICQPDQPAAGCGATATCVVQ